MTDRVVKVNLQAQVANYLSNMEQARKKTQENAKASEDLSQKFAEQHAAMQTVGAGITAFGALAAVGVGLAVAKFAEFDQAMSNVSAATHESVENMVLLRDAALDAGSRTVFSATEAANAIEELSKAGVETADILSGGLDAALDLAAAGGLGVAEAAGIAATALKTFKLEGSDMSHVADLLAAGAGKAMGDVTDLSAALAQAGLVANSTGLTIDETTAGLAAFASQGLLGSDAGTSLKTMLGALTPNSVKAANEMERLGISAYDAQGNFVGLESLAGNLRDSMARLTPEARSASLEIMFGSDAVRAATVLYDEGAEGIAKWEAKVNDSGYAAETAAIRLDNLKGDVEALGGAFDTALIKSGEAANDSLRFLVQAGTQLVDVFNDAHPSVQQTALVLGGVTAAAGLAGGAFLLGVPKIAEFSLALATLTTSTIPGVAAAALTGQRAIAGMSAGMGKAAAFMTGPWGVALAAAAVGVALLTKVIDDLQASTSEMENSLATATSAAQVLAVAGEGKEWKWLSGAKEQLADLPAVLQASADQSKDLFARFDQTHFGAFDALKQVGESLGQMSATDLPAAQNGFRMLVKETDATEQSQWRLLNTMPGYLDALKAQANELDINVTSADEAANKTALLELAFGNATPTALDAADAYLKTADEAAGLDKKVRELTQAINEANGVGQDAVSANINYGNALADVDEFIRQAREGVEGFSLGMDQSTQAGRDNMQMVSDLAGDYQNAADKQLALDGNTEAYVANLAAGREAVLQRARDLGATDEQIQYLSEHIVAMPSEKEVRIVAETAAAQKQLDDFITTASGRQIYVGILASETALDNVKYSRATGGILPGAPSSTDNMLIHAASGEFVTNAAATMRNRDVLEYINGGGVIQGFSNGGFVSGRDVQYERSAPPVSSQLGGGRSISSSVQVVTTGLDAPEVAAVVDNRQNWSLGRLT